MKVNTDNPSSVVTNIVWPIAVYYCECDGVLHLPSYCMNINALHLSGSISVNCTLVLLLDNLFRMSVNLVVFLSRCYHAFLTYCTCPVWGKDSSPKFKLRYYKGNINTTLNFRYTVFPVFTTSISMCMQSLQTYKQQYVKTGDCVGRNLNRVRNNYVNSANSST